MTRKPVTSSSISSVGYDPESKILHVEFGSGRVYEYAGVTAEQHAELVNAPSIGAHFGKQIRPRFDGRPL